jgi:MFS transporter, SHS family, sialic acid transporter
MTAPAVSTRGRNLALLAALLGWMFDGMEMGLFPLVGKEALTELLHVPERFAAGAATVAPGSAAEKALKADLVDEVNQWYGIIIACFLVWATRSAASGR